MSCVDTYVRTYLARYHEILAGFAEDVAALGTVAQAQVAEHRVAEGALLVAVVADDLAAVPRKISSVFKFPAAERAGAGGTDARGEARCDVLEWEKTRPNENHKKKKTERGWIFQPAPVYHRSARPRFARL